MHNINAKANIISGQGAFKTIKHEKIVPFMERTSTHIFLKSIEGVFFSVEIEAGCFLPQHFPISCSHQDLTIALISL